MDSDKLKNFSMGEIYIARNRETMKAYVGQARKYLSSGQKWGYEARWTRHGQEANAENRQGYDRLINQAIREHGLNGFDVVKLCDCKVEELDYYEQKYIKEFNTMEPDGYNMTAGGRDGAHSQTANDKKKVKRKPYSDESKENIRLASMGRRYECKGRLHEEDNELPKYVHAIRKDGEVIGYQVKKFPIGIEKAEYVYKTFKRKQDLPSAKSDAIKYVDFLKTTYQKKVEDYKATKALLEQEKKSEEYASTRKKLPNLPQYIYHFFVDDNLIGYYVKGLKDCEGVDIPRRDFTEHTNSINIDHAKRFIEEVEFMNKNSCIPDDWTTLELSKKQKSQDLPKHIRPQYFNGNEIGYRVDFFIKYDENKKKVMVAKSFCNKKKTMEEKLAMAKEFVSELIEKYKSNH